MDLAMENRKKAYAVNKKNDVDGLFVDKTEEMRVKFSQPIEEDGDEGSEASDENKEKEKKGGDGTIDSKPSLSS